MKGNSIQQATIKARQVITQNSPTILTGLSVAGLLSTVTMAVRATPKAMRIINDEYDELEKEGIKYQPFTKKEIVQLTWKCYIPTIIMGGVSIVCIVGANSINLRRNAALASVYSITETALKEYQAKVVETFGEAKAQKVKDDIAKDRLDKNPVVTSEIALTGKGETLCYDVFSGRYFKSDIENIRKVQNELNRDLLNDSFISLNDAYYYLGLGSTKLGDELGWDINEGLIEFNFSSQLTEYGIPCLVIDYNVGPRFCNVDY